MCKTLLLCLTCLFVFAITDVALAQSGRLSGMVTDPQGAAIPKATIRVTSLDAAVTLTAESDGSGSYTVPYLRAGRYRVIVQAQGFSQSVSGDLAIAEGQVLIYNIRLTVGGEQSIVTVNGGNDVTALHTENAELSGTITTKEVAAIGLNGRNFSQLIALVPGVSNQTQQDEARVGVRGSVSFSVNGGRTEYNSFQVDGSETINTGLHKDNTSLIVTPSVDAIQEIRVLTSNYGAQYSSTGNGTTIVTTKSGGDQYHGNVYEFFRNEALNAKGYFDVANKAPEYRRNDFGGTIGGPLSIPHLYNGKGRTHVFFSEEARIEKDPYAYRQAVPSLAERNGDYNDVCPYAPPGVTIQFKTADYPDCPTSYSPALTGYTRISTVPTFPGNIVPVAPAATALLNTGILPAPNAASGCNSKTGTCYNGEVSLPTYWREELFRIDQTITSKMLANFRYIHDEWDTTTPVPQYGIVQNSFPTIRNRFYGPGLSLAGHLTSTLTSQVVNEFVVSYTDQHIVLSDLAAPFVALERPAILDSNLGHLFDNGFGGKLPGIVIAGNNAAYGGNGFAVDPSYLPWSHTNPTYNFADNVSQLLGRHSLQYGLQLIFLQRNQLNGAIGAASGDVQSLMTFNNERSVYSTGNAFADFLGMHIASVQQDSAQNRYYQRSRVAEPYVQDTWKVNSRLTLDIGLRLSIFGAFYEKNKNAYNWVPGAYSRSLAETVVVDPVSGALLDSLTIKPLPTHLGNGQVNPVLINGIVRCGTGGVPAGCLKSHQLINPAPRVGFTWDPAGTGKMVLRAGYGVFFEHGTPDEANTGSLEASAPFVLSATQLSPVTADCIGNTGSKCPYGPGAFPLNVTAIPTQGVWPYVQQWSLGIEHTLPANLLASFAYVGSRGTHLTTELQLNQLRPLPAALNPFGPNEPLLLNTCDLGQFGGGFSTNGYTLPSGPTVFTTSPGYVNMQAACYGRGLGGVLNPNSLRQAYPGLGQIHSLQNVASSSYNAFQTTLRRAQGPLILGIAYTYSHSLDNASDRSDTTFVNSFDLRANRASSNFDQRHLLHVSYIYDLPLVALANGLFHRSDVDANKMSSVFSFSSLTRTILGGWQLSGVTLFESGIPFSILNGGSPNGVSALDNAGVANGVGTGSYPDVIGNPHGKRPAVTNSSSFGPLLLNPGAFAAPRGLTFGNAGRNFLNNPSRLNFDAALLKEFRIREVVQMQFRAEGFNVFNHTQFRIYDPAFGNQANNTISCYADSPDSKYSAAGDAKTDCLTGSSFLHPYDAHRPRTIQLGLKLEF